MKKFLRTLTAATLVAVGATSATFGFSACGGKSQAGDKPSDSEITRLVPPADGSLPTAHTADENLAYLAYVLDNQPQYHCYTYTVTQASIATQYTKSYKDYRDGITISSDITYSSMVKSGTQACFVSGADGPEAYMRTSAAPSSDTTNLTAQWNTGEPVYFDEQSYLTTYGLFQTEMTNYIINDLTITDSSAASDNGDGTYTQSVVLDPVASTYYYQYGMKTRGGLNGFPEFETVNLSFTFDADWQVLSIEVEEVAKVNKGVTVTSKSRSMAEYSYDAADFEEEHFAYYDSYFKQYVGSSSLRPGGGEQAAPDVATVLSNGFSQVMNGGQQFEVSLSFGDKKYEGYIFLGLDLADPLNSLNIKLSLGHTLAEQGLYIEYCQGDARAYYGKDFALTANMAALKLIVGQFTDWADGLNSVLSNDSGSALEDLLSSFELVTGDHSASLTLKDDNLLGLGVGLNASFLFDIGEDNAISFSSAEIGGLTLGGEGIDLSLSLATTSAPVIDREHTSAEADLADYAADIFSLLGRDLIAVNLKLDGQSDSVKIPSLKGVSGNVTALVDINGLAVGAQADIAYTYGKNTYSASLEAHYSYDPSTYGRIIVSLTSVNGVRTDITLGCDISELAEAVNTLFTLADIQINGLSADGSGVSLSVAEIINNVLSADFSSILKELSLNNSKISLTADIDGIIALFAPETGISFGTVGLTYNYGGGAGGELSATLPALGLDLSVKGADGSLSEPPKDYVDLSDIVNVAGEAYSVISGIMRDKAINIVIPSGGNVLTYGSVKLAVTGTISARWGSSPRVAADLNLAFGASQGKAVTNLKLIYNPSAAADQPVVRLSINGAALDIFSADLGGVQSQIDGLALATAGMTEGQSGLVSLILDMLAGGQWVEFLNDLTLTADGQSVALGYLGDITAGVSVDVSQGLTLAVSAESGKLCYNGEFSVVDADIYPYVDRQIDKSSPSSTANGDNIIKVVYDYVIDAFNAVDLSQVLGGAYTVGIKLDGDNSAIPALKGVRADASVVFAQFSEGVNVADITADIEYSGISASFRLTLIGEEVYASITDIAGRQIASLKVKTTADSLFSLIQSLSSYASESGARSLSDGAADAAERAMTDIIYTLATIDWNEYVLFTSSQSAKGAIVDVDGLLSAFGVDAGFMVGCVTAQFEDDLAFSASASYSGKEWLSFSAAVADADYSSFDFSGYIDFSSVTSLPLADILSLLSAENLNLSLSLATGDIKVVSNAYVTPVGMTVLATADITYLYQNKPITACLTAYYSGETVYLRVSEIAGIPCNVALYCSQDDLMEGVAAILSAAQLELGGIQSGVGADLSSLLSKLLSADFSKILSDVYADENCVKADIDLDSLLSQLGIDAGVKAGSLTLAFEGGVLSGKAQSLGLSFALGRADSIPSFDTSDCLDIASTVREVAAVIESRNFSVNVVFDGSKTGVEELGALYATLNANVSLKDGARAAAELTARYGSLSIGISARYISKNGADYVYLLAHSINGKSASIAVYCEVGELSAAVGALLGAVGGQAALTSGGDMSAAADVLSALLAADLSKIVKELSASAEGANIRVDLDELLAAAGYELPSLGELSFNYTAGSGEAVASIAKWGLSATVSGVRGNVDYTIPAADYLNLSDLVNFVAKAYGGVNAIIRDQSLAFSISQSAPAYITVDGITASVWGNGEISWKGGAQSVALDLKFALAEGVGRDEMTFKLVYDGQAAENQPFVTFAINNVGAAVRRADVDGIKSKLDQIVSSVAALTGNNAGRAVVLSAAPTGSDGHTQDDVVYAILALLSRTDWVDALNNLTLSCDGNSLVLGILGSSSFGVSVDESGFVLTYFGSAAGDGADFSTGARIELGQSSEKLGGELIKQMSGADYNIASSEGGNFIKDVYDNLFEAIRSVSVADILGDKVYNVSFDLNGANTGVEEMSDVFVHAEMYVKNNLKGGTTIQLDLNFNIAGAVVNGSVIIDNDKAGGNTYFYIDLTRVLNITLNGLKVSATQDTLYDTVAALIDVVCDTDILKGIASLIPSGGEVKALALDGQQKASAADIVYGILSLDFSSLITGATTGGVTTATIDLDGIMGGLGLNIGSLGAIECRIDHKTHSITSSAVAAGMEEEWLSLSSRRLNEAEITSLTYALANVDTSRYIDLAFLPSLIADLKASVTDENGAMYNAITFAGGTLKAKMLGLLEVTISDLKVTANLDPDAFYLALQGNLSGSLVSKHTIGLTYQNGYLTLYRSDNGGEYRVMTFEYFIDNLFGDKNKSTLNWLLGVNDFIWSMVGGLVPEVSSGLTTPGSLYLYSVENVVAGEEISVNDYVKALSVVLGGEEVLDYASAGGSTQSLIFSLGLAANNNYYGFELNAPLLTDGVLTELSAAILRDGNGGGITGLAAYGAIQSYVTFTLNLSYDRSYNEQPLASHFEAVRQGFANYAQGGAITDGPDRIFGCYNSADNSVDFSQLLTAYTLKVNNLDGTVTEYTVREGTAVYLYSNAYPVYTDESKQFRLVYTMNGSLCTNFTVSGDAEVFAEKRGAVEFTITNDKPYAEGFVYHSFIGDTLPYQFEGVTSAGGYTFKADGTPVGGKVVEGNTPLEIVGTFSPSSVSEGSVIYTFSAEDGSYHVSGTEAGFIQLYSGNDSTLFIAGSINGIPVTAIDADAFALEAADAEKSVKNVFVPASVISVGERAFLNNAGMNSVVFLAENVSLSGSGENLPFYGCSSADNSSSTQLKVFYTQISSGADWTAFASGKHIGTDGGALHSGDWAYISGAQIADEILPADVAIDGVSFGEYALQVLESAVILRADFASVCENYRASLQEVLDAYTLGTVNKTNVYEVSVSVSGDGIECSFAVSVAQGNPVENVPVKVISRVDFTYGATKYSFDDTNGYMSEVSAEVRGGAIINAKTPAARGYVFLGWATVIDGTMQFARFEDPSLVYYAVWAIEKEGVTYSLQTSGSVVEMPVLASGSFYGWYADGAYEQLITTQSQVALTPENTVFNVRRQYSMGISVSGGTDNGLVNKKTYFYIDGQKVGEGKNYSSGAYTVLEGEEVRLEAYSEGGDNGYRIITQSGEVKVCAWLMSRSGWFGSWSKSSCHTINPDRTSFVVSGDISVNFTIS